MTDAVHMLTDVVGILFSLLALWLSTKPPTKRFTFGLHRLGKSQVSEAFTLLPPTTSFSPLLVSCVRQTDTGHQTDVVLMQMNHVQSCKCVFRSVQARSDSS